MDINDITPQWLAGFFDGEGCVHSHASAKSYNVLITLTNCDLEIMALLFSKFPNGQITDKAKFEKRRSCLRIAWQGRFAKDLLSYILPYSIIKKQRINAALSMLQLVDKGRTEGREEFYNVIKNANENRSENNIPSKII